MWRVGLTFDLPFDLLLGQSILELLVAQCVGDWHDLWTWPLTYWLNINRDHLLIKDYLPTKFEDSVAKRSWVISCTRYGRSTLPLTLTFDLLTWITIGIIYLSWTIYLPSLKLVGQSIVELSVAQCIGAEHDPWPTDLNIYRDHLLIKNYLPTKLEASGAKCSWVMSCTRLRETDIPTDRQTDMCNAICPPYSRGGGGHKNKLISFHCRIGLHQDIPVRMV